MCITATWPSSHIFQLSSIWGVVNWEVEGGPADIFGPLMIQSDRFTFNKIVDLED